MDKGSRALRSLHLLIPTVMFCMITGLLFMPSLVFGQESSATYDKTTIRYPSMFVGQIWTKSGESPTPARNDGIGQVSAGNRKDASSSLKSNQVTKPADKDTANGKNALSAERHSSAVSAQRDPAVKKEPVLDQDVKKKLKQKRLKAVRAIKERTEKKTASISSSPAPAADKDNSKASEDKTLQIKKTAASRSPGISVYKSGLNGKNWHHKQQLYDVECSQRLARVIVTYYFDKDERLVQSTVTPEADWYHIYPGSLEEKLYVELCHPSMY